ncbi:PEP-CTERM sorting domain-containing protein [Roseateles sp.]|jgi:hypothetical protein|uniref:PEP-CTERM sorting domain-containing protein n=1 Tax=Roseateles sp. TaxID=1971397 RepID=UPI003BAAE4BD
MSMTRSLISLAALCALAASSQADTFVTPGDETSGLNTAFRNAPRTYMALYTSVNFETLTSPVWITGMQLRISADGNTALPATWPSQDLTFTNFNVQLSQASSSLLSDGEFLLGTEAFAAQQAAGTVVNVRSGSLSISTASFQNSGGENSFGALISFSTPYLYTPGQSLLLYLTHTGYAPGTEAQPFFAVTDYSPGVTDAISSTAGYQAANATGFSSPYIVQFTTTPVPEPSTMLMLAGGIVGLLALNRRRRATDAA